MIYFYKQITKFLFFLFSIRLFKFHSDLKKITKCDVLFYLGDSNRTILLDGKAYSALIDPIRERLEINGFSTNVIAKPFSEKFGSKAYGKPFCINRDFLFSILKRKFLGNRVHDELFRIIFSNSAPRLIVTIGSNEFLARAARYLNIPHAELLHGIGYPFLPWGWGDVPECNLPQIIFSLDPISTKTFSELSHKNIYVREVVHPFYEKYIYNNDVVTPAEWEGLKKKSNNFKRTVVFTLQWGYANGIDVKTNFANILDNGMFPCYIEEAIDRTQEDILWVFKLHPVHIGNPYKYRKLYKILESLELKYKNVIYEKVTHIPLPLVLKDASAHITMCSMSSYEAAYIGVKTLALCPTLRRGGAYFGYFEDLVNAHYLTKENLSVDNLVNWVNEVDRVPPFLIDSKATSCVDLIIEIIS